MKSACNLCEKLKVIMRNKWINNTFITNIKRKWSHSKKLIREKSNHNGRWKRTVFFSVWEEWVVAIPSASH